jgi:hypothetical protein
MLGSIDELAIEDPILAEDDEQHPFSPGMCGK